MVGRISPQTPEPGSHQHCSETLRTAHYSLPTLFAHTTKPFPRHLHHVAPISLPFSAASAYFLSRRGCTTLRHSRRSDVRTCNVPTLLFTKACRLFALFCGPPPFVFNGLQPLFAKHPGGGVCPQTRQLKSMGSSLLLFLRPSPPSPVLNSFLSSPPPGYP